MKETLAFETSEEVHKWIREELIPEQRETIQEHGPLEAVEGVDFSEYDRYSIVVNLDPPQEMNHAAESVDRFKRELHLRIAEAIVEMVHEGHSIIDVPDLPAVYQQEVV
ncbi:hypothetical protein HLRTI_000447 [Halorhabdus tiamatea SARL4B]|uniref:Uncharacterized protein n=1 Tax=Halorhabdus tiamatea SARL4B TaxID=1033806 RepID=U2FBM2_9EURY|nr:hypothetical protein [Halorhabdus tiamatea]ERJ07405.1 hypothetical protein HLRTI_000447 [Halorhabdus tiamatea SARL4B]